MNFLWVFVIFCEIGATAKVPNTNAFQKAFTDIVDTVSKQSHFLSIVRSGDTTDLTISKAYAGNPHNVVAFAKESKDF